MILEDVVIAEERVDFTERLLAKGRGRETLLGAL